MNDRRKTIVTWVIAAGLVGVSGLALVHRRQPRGETVTVPTIPARELTRHPVETTPPEPLGAATTTVPIEPQPPSMPTKHDELEAQQRVETARSGGVRTGIAAFNPPGTSPLKQGLVVPDDYELPKGYVRHYQNTDDGHHLQPILMYAPGFTPIDANGAALPVPPIASSKPRTLLPVCASRC